MSMDLKVKGITWVGNIYQKFEAMCQEVDDIVSRDTVKYVENQVQTVGESVKKFCSDVVQDFVDPAKREAQVVAVKRNADIGTYIKSMIGIKENSVDMITKQSPVEPNAKDPAKKQLVHASRGLHHVNQRTTPTSVDPLDLAPRQIGNGLTNENSDVSMEENAIKEKSYAPEMLDLSPDEKESFEASLFSELIDENYENAFGVLVEVSPATSAYGAGLQSPQKGGTVCDYSAGDNECVSDASSTLTSSEMAPSVVSSDKIIAETELASSSSFSLMEPYRLSENLFENFPPKAVFGNNTVDVAGCVSDSSSVLLSSTLAPTLSCKNKVEEMGLVSSSSVLSLESIGLSVDSDDINDPSMETIELCDKVKLEESCVIVDSSELYAVSRRVRNLRSYKKKIQDAFASKKRIAKEYEQLAIWYGDSDIEFSQGTSQISLLSKPTTLLGSNSLQPHHTSDSEWEFL